MYVPKESFSILTKTRRRTDDAVTTANGHFDCHPVGRRLLALWCSHQITSAPTQMIPSSLWFGFEAPVRGQGNQLTLAVVSPQRMTCSGQVSRSRRRKKALRARADKRRNFICNQYSLGSTLCTHTLTPLFRLFLYGGLNVVIGTPTVANFFC